MSNAKAKILQKHRPRESTYETDTSYTSKSKAEKKARKNSGVGKAKGWAKSKSRMM